MLRLVLSSKRNKMLLVLFFAMVAALLFWLDARRVDDLADPTAPAAPTPGQELAPPLNDAAIYQTVEAYITALIADDRPAVLALLTAAHQETFGENSFLLQTGALENHSEISLAKLDHSFPLYTSQFPGLEGQQVAVIVAEYTVSFFQNDQLTESPIFREELALRQEEGRWLIAASQRDFLRLAEQVTP